MKFRAGQKPKEATSPNRVPALELLVSSLLETMEGLASQFPRVAEKEEQNAQDFQIHAETMETIAKAIESGEGLPTPDQCRELAAVSRAKAGQRQKDAADWRLLAARIPEIITQARAGAGLPKPK